MNFLAINKMLERVERAREDSDTNLFTTLLYLGEMTTKTVVSGLVAAIVDDRERHRYRQLHRLIRADGIGEWCSSLDDILIGPSAQHLLPTSRQEQRELTQKSQSGTWQYEAVLRLSKSLSVLGIPSDELKLTTDLRKWFSYFALLRNKTRGHGAPSTDICGKVCTEIEMSIRLILDNYMLFKREWAYLYRNLSGKYRVTKLTETIDSFENLKKVSTYNYPNGVYVYYDEPVKVELISSDAEAYDFYYANGCFKGKRFEFLSYISGNKLVGDATPYLKPASELPASETQGLGELEVQGKCFGNLPPKPIVYIKRIDLEDELYKTLTNDRHPVITLVGRGGIGKTSVALSVLHKVSEIDRFAALLLRQLNK